MRRTRERSPLASSSLWLVGYSEYQEGFGSPGVTAVINGLADQVIGKNPRATEKIYADMYAVTRPAAVAQTCSRNAAARDGSRSPASV